MKLRPLKKKDVQAMLEWMHDPDINAVFSADFSKFTEQDVLRFIVSAQDETTAVHRACVDENDVYLGTVSLKHIDRLARNAEYAVSFGKYGQGTGAAQFATQKILELGFEELNLERIYLNVLSDNRRANRFYQKTGFVFEGTFVKHIIIHGELKDLNWYRLLKEEYFQQRNH